jgi:hypothetical protein
MLMKKFTITTWILMAVLSLTLSSFAQTKAKKPIKKAAAKKAPAAKTQPVVEPAVTKVPVKKNERPETQAGNADGANGQEPQKKNQSQKTQTGASIPAAESQNVFSYEFTQPDFVVKHIIIEHDENGKGKITFEKKGFEEPVTDPLQLSTVSIEKIKNLFQTLNFLDSTENYQSTVRQYPHLGTLKFRLKKEGKNRTTEFNWTENKDAKALADEYRKIGEQFVWIFNMSIARENQPLEAPGLMDALDSLLKRGEISDPPQMIPLLKKLSDDERIPLIARNHASRMVKDIEKKAGK